VSSQLGNDPQRLRLYALLAACVLVSGAVGLVLALHLTPWQFAAVLALWAVAGVLAWWRWRTRDLYGRHRLDTRRRAERVTLTMLVR
jgi:hypothetical protein